MIVLDLTTVIVWTLRIVLPILFFAIYFKLQGPPKQLHKHAAGPTTNVIKKDKFLVLRKSVEGQPAPASMRNIALKDQTQAPQLFAGSGRGPRPDRPRRTPDDAKPKDQRPKQDKKDSKAKPPAAASSSAEDEKLHLEAVLNYVAFQKSAEEAFLSASSSGPKGDDESSMVSKFREMTTSKANHEAQMVLRGAMQIQRPDVAKQLYEQLNEAHVEISEQSFVLMIDVCLLASDLKGASDFLMKLENAGFSPSSELLDKVLDLYSKQTEQGTLPQAEEPAPAEASRLEDLLSEAAISSAAAEGFTEKANGEAAQMVSWVAPMPAAPVTPMFNWDAIESDDDSDDDDNAVETTKTLNTDAPEFVPSFMPGPATKMDSTESQELSNLLSATAEPWNPYNNMSYDPSMYGWTSWDNGGDESSYADNGKGKSKGKGKGKRKSKGEWNDGWHDWNDNWHSKSGGSRGDWNNGWQSTASKGQNHSSQVEDAQEDARTQSKDAKNWKKSQSQSQSQMTWKPKSENAES